QLPGSQLLPMAPFILQPPVFHPVLPYITTIFGGLTPGKMVLVQGVVLMEAERFQVDFQSGCNLKPRPDIIVHFNPRGHWLDVNGQHFLQYCYRLPLARVNTLGVFGDIFVKAIAFLPGNPFDVSRPGYLITPLLFLSSSELAMPYTCLLPGGLVPGNTITVRALVDEDPMELSLSLKEDLAHIPLMLRACFRDRTLTWESFSNETQGSGRQIVSCFPFLPPSLLRGRSTRKVRLASTKRWTERTATERGIPTR
uniref:Galectin n=1 Tax=Sphenodon punctatus TaxID=8508 RepID=A0A8D0H7M1_SPHPU